VTAQPDSSFQSLRKVYQDRPVLWLGCDPPVSPRNGPRGPPLWVVLTLVKTTVSSQALQAQLAELVGPFDAIVFEPSFLQQLGANLRLLKTALLKLCHHDTRLVSQAQQIEPSAIGAAASEKILEEIRRILRQTPSEQPVGRVQSSARRDRLDTDLRSRWQGSGRKAPGLVTVIGAGIAGVTITLELLRRGHQVHLLDADAEVLAQGSNQPRLACHPHFAKVSNPLSSLSLTALELTLRGPLKQFLNPCGRFQAAQSSMEAAEQRLLVAALALPRHLLAYLDPAQANQKLFGTDSYSDTFKDLAHAASLCVHGGLWMEAASNLDTRMLRDHMTQLALEQPRQFQLRLNQRLGPSELASILRPRSRTPEKQAKDSVTAEEPNIVVLATGASSPALLESIVEIEAESLFNKAKWQILGGRSFEVHCDAPMTFAQAMLGGAVSVQSLEQTWNRSGSAMRGQADLKQMLIGASYFDERQAEPSQETQWQDLRNRAASMLGQEPEALVRTDSFRGQRCYVLDRMPLIGPVLPHQRIGPAPSRSQLYLASAFGSRGLLWAHLAARLIADHVDGISPQLGMKALKSIDPYRFR
jgi:tRNA 5-methylaminomethyl-2-thiouridine biosynthesis bifunctional protein